MNEKIIWKDLRQPSFTNILALNAFAHHDIITLPIGINQTVTTETLDVVEDATSRIPVIGGLLNTVIGGFHNLVFGKSPSGFKKGGIDSRLNYYGDAMVGLMSREMSMFYTDQYYNSLNTEQKGILPFNAFQDQGNEPLSTLLNATSNSTVLNFKVTDIIEASVYNKKNQKPKISRVDIVSTVHIAQTPGEELDWDKEEVVLVDKNFNTLVDPRDSKVISKFGKNSDDERLYVVNEVCVQAIGAGDITVTFFSQDPTKYGYEQVSIWEGRFRNYAKVTKSTRGWTTTIRFEQPMIKGEDGKFYKYRYPQTVLTDIQRRPNLPPPPYEDPRDENSHQLWTHSVKWEDNILRALEVDEFLDLNLKKDTTWTADYKDSKNAYKDIQLVYSLPAVLVIYLDYNQKEEEYTLFASSSTYISSSRYKGTRYYKSRTMGDLVERAKVLKATKRWNYDHYKIILDWEKEYIWENIYTEDAYTRTERATSKPNWGTVPPLSTPWEYWHAYIVEKELLVRDNIPKSNKVVNLWYSGLYLDKKE